MKRVLTPESLNGDAFNAQRGALLETVERNKRALTMESLNIDVLNTPRDVLLEAIERKVREVKRNDFPVKLYRFGFLRVQLTQERLEEGNSLHLWLPGTLDCDEAPHRHNCQIDSMVVFGQVTNKTWTAPQLDANGEYQWVKTECTDTICRDLGSSGRATVIETGSQDLGPTHAADKYSIPLGEFHSSQLEGTAITIIRKSNFDDPYAPVDNLLPLDTTPKTKPFDITTYNQITAWAELRKGLALVGATI